MTVTFNLPALLGTILTIVGTTLVGLQVVGALPHEFGLLGLVLVVWGGLAWVEYRLERHSEQLAEREMAAYEAGRLRGV